ncbi:hypothetical protein [Caballeronia sp. SL2Y3]|uniref:hypothetical protein n=1 Tax=Caballeronia sp. SL2Y3 TaxID=2878151 RepID=UPI001FD3123A|nr:hypothetical protein [Caballeronia sp. SL2Y3]
MMSARIVHAKSGMAALAAGLLVSGCYYAYPDYPGAGYPTVSAVYAQREFALPANAASGASAVPGTGIVYSTEQVPYSAVYPYAAYPYAGYYGYPYYPYPYPAYYGYGYPAISVGFGYWGGGCCWGHGHGWHGGGWHHGGGGWHGGGTWQGGHGGYGGYGGGWHGGGGHGGGRGH